MSHFQKSHSAAKECDGIGGVSEMAQGCVPEGSESSPGEHWGSGSGELAWMLAPCVFLAGRTTWRAGKNVLFSGAPQTRARVFIFYTKV